MCRKILYIPIIAYLFIINQTYAHDISANGTLKIQYGINDKDRTRVIFNANSNFLYSHDINDYITAGSFVSLSTSMLSNSVNRAGHFKPDILDIKSKAKDAYIFLRSPKVGSIKIGLTDPVTNSMKISSSDILASVGINGSWLQYNNLRDKIVICPDSVPSSSDYSEVYKTDICINPTPRSRTHRAEVNSSDSHIYGYEINAYGVDMSDTISVQPLLYTGYYGLSIPVISYYSPQFKGLKVGFSYIPKMNNGDVTVYNDIIGGAVKYQNKVFNVNYALSGVIEYAAATNEAKTSYKYNDMLSYSTGILLNYKNITIAGSYGNLGKSGIGKFSVYPQVKDSPEVYEILDNEFYDLGVKLDISNGYNIGLTYFYNNKDVIIKEGGSSSNNTHQKNHSLSVYTLGIEKALPNKISCYADMIYFTVNKPLIPYGNYSGYSILIGTKYSF